MLLWVEQVLKKGTLPETNSSHLKMDAWNSKFLLGSPIFRGELLVLGSAGGISSYSSMLQQKITPLHRQPL